MVEECIHLPSVGKATHLLDHGMDETRKHEAELVGAGLTATVITCARGSEISLRILEAQDCSLSRDWLSHS